MRNPSPGPETAAPVPLEARAEGQGPAGALSPAGRDAAVASRADSPAEAQGRRTLSTAFVMVGPDGHLTVELRDGRAMVLRDVIMRPRDFCGVQVVGGSAGKRFCSGYGAVAAARPGGAPIPDAPGPAALDPVEPERSPSKPE